jgi:cytochrome c oxidase subunit 2
MYRRRETLENGESIVADEAYLTDSMIDPRGKIVKGFKPVMPTYKGRLAAPEAAALVEFIKSLRSTSLENTPSKEAVYEPAQRRQ